MTMTLDDFRQVISEICRIPLEQIKEDSMFRDHLGVDSLTMVNLLLEIADRYGLELGVIQSHEDVQSVGSLYRKFLGGETG
jgi:acyl carrier protein